MDPIFFQWRVTKACSKSRETSLNNVFNTAKFKVKLFLFIFLLSENEVNIIVTETRPFRCITCSHFQLFICTNILIYNGAVEWQNHKHKIKTMAVLSISTIMFIRVKRYILTESTAPLFFMKKVAKGEYTDTKSNDKVDRLATLSRTGGLLYTDKYCDLILSQEGYLSVCWGIWEGPGDSCAAVDLTRLVCIIKCCLFIINTM